MLAKPAFPPWIPTKALPSPTVFSSQSLFQMSYPTRVLTLLAPSCVQPLPLLIRFRTGSDPRLVFSSSRLLPFLSPVQAGSRETSFNRCGGSTSLGAGNGHREHLSWGNFHQHRFSGSFLLPFCFLQSPSPCASQKTSQRHGLWQPHSSLAVKKVSCNLAMMSRMMR